MKRQKKRLGDILIEAGLINSTDLASALEYSKKKSLKLGEALKELGLVNEHELSKALSRQLGIPLVDLERIVLDPSLAEVLPEIIARKHLAIPLGKRGREFLIAVADPLNIFGIDEIARHLKGKVTLCIAPESQIQRAIDRLYGATGSQGRAASIETRPGDASGTEEDTEAVQLINDIILQAAREEASDIHIEPLEHHVRIRIRVDGILKVIRQLPKEIHPSLVSRIKVMSGMDIGERRKPQDGRFDMGVAGKEIDFRCSCMPTSKGEKIVMRLLDKSSIRLSLLDLGLEPGQKKVLEQAIRRPYGMVLVTGPTGSGKTTTLYACLQTINSIEKNIVTVEDPVEYELEGVSQVQVNPKADLTFANALRSILRQDPDVVMIGEIRDVETADIAIQASLTGHLVLSTLHTNTAAGAVARLIDMEIQPFLIASSLVVSLAQRLVRRLCPECREEFDPPQELRDELRLDRLGPDAHFFRARGCPKCGGVGYKGRVAIFEVLEVDKDIDTLIIKKASSGTIFERAKETGMLSLREAGLRKAASGITTLEEVVRVTVDTAD